MSTNRLSASNDAQMMTELDRFEFRDFLTACVWQDMRKQGMSPAKRAELEIAFHEMRCHAMDKRREGGAA